MNKPLLSILIPTVIERVNSLNKLISTFDNYRDREYSTNGWFIQNLNTPIIASIKWNKDVEIIYCLDNKEMTIGEKRETLYEIAYGTYSIQVDDDDELADDAIEKILIAAKSTQNVDCITFEEYIDIDGKIQRSNHSLIYDDWHDNYEGYDYVRTPFFKSVIKTEIAKSVPIPHIRFGEDHLWAQALKPHLNTEIHIPFQLYRYIHKSSNPTERYGLDR